MARPQRIEYPGAFYHVTSRGNEKGAIFWEDRDRHKFLALVDSVHQRYGILIYAYVLMRNHYHVLMGTPQGNLAKVMHDLNSSYTGYVNSVHDRVGHLFQGRYKAILVDKDSYLIELSRYINLNPVRAKIVRLPEDYAWSGVKYFLGKTRAPAWFDIDFTLRLFSNTRRIATAAYLDFIHEDIGKRNPLSGAFAQCIMGSETFIAKVKDMHMKADHVSPDVVRAKSLSTKATLDSISKLVSGETGLNMRTLPMVQTRKENLGLKVFISLAHKHTDKTHRDIAAYLGRMKSNAVAQMHLRFMRQIAQDEALQATVARIEQKMI